MLAGVFFFSNKVQSKTEYTICVLQIIKWKEPGDRDREGRTCEERQKTPGDKMRYNIAGEQKKKEKYITSKQPPPSPLPLSLAPSSYFV